MSQKSVLAAAIAAVAGATLGCTGCDVPLDDRDGGPNGTGGQTSTATGTGLATLDPHAGLCVPPEWVETAWPGWHRWPYAPCDCHVFVPDDLSAVEAPPWETCPYMEEGCVRATAPWAEEPGVDGYGAGVFEVSVHDGHEYLAAHRYFGTEFWTDTLLLRDQKLVGVWRSKISDGGGDCSVRGPSLGADGLAALSLVRLHFETEPHVFLGPPETLISQPERTVVFGPEPPLPIPSGLVTRSERLLVMKEQYGRFTVRDLETGKTYRPELPVPGEMTHPIPVGNSIVYWIWTEPRKSVWVWSAEEGSRPLLMDGTYSYVNFLTDQKDAVWVRGKNPTGANSYEETELWTAPLDLEPGAMEPRKLATVPVAGYTSLGSGWAAIGGIPPQSVRLYRLSDGLERMLPELEGYDWHTGEFTGLRIKGGAVWVRSSRNPGPGSDIRFLTRFELDALPAPP